MTKIRVGFDWDDVVDAWYAPAHEACKRAGITNGVEPTRWRVHEEYGIEVGLWRDTIRAAFRRGEIYNEPPHEEAIWAMRDLYWNHAKEVDIVIATARAEFLGFDDREAIQDQLLQKIEDYAIPCDELIFTHNKVSANCDWFIDDSAKHYYALREVGVMAYLRNQSWNQDAPLVPLSHRVSSVTEYVEIIKEELCQSSQ